MSLYKTIGLTAAGIVWLATSASAQRVTTNPTAVPNTVSTPTFSPDTLRPSRDKLLNDNTAGQDDADRKNRREQKRALRRNKRSSENSRMNRSGNNPADGNSTAAPNTNPQDAAYRQGSVSNGTTNNNSNTTNYNSSNVMTAPTGAGSNPSSTGAAGDVRPGATTTGSTAPSGSAGGGSTATAGTPNLSQPAATGSGAAVSGASNAPIVNSSAHLGNTTLADFVASQPDYSTLQNALQSADLIPTLREGQAYTVFAPSNAAFKKLPAATQNVLLEGQNKESLKKLLTYHVVLGAMNAKELARQISAGNGTARLKTVSGGQLTAKAGADGRVMITDDQGNTALIDTPDKVQANGVIHGIDKVLMPKANTIIFR